MHARAARFAALYALMRAAADLGDHWIQSDHCARTKGATNAAPVTADDGTTHGTAAGRKACAWHCTTYTATQVAALLIGSRVLGLRLHPGATAAALAVSGLTHYAADRRVPGGLLQRVADATGKGNFYRLAGHGMNGSYALDQAWHHTCETVAALIAATK
ncbi:hypothetical protein E4198_00140 [Streptomyces sp. RKND-216]|uniref:hypothetical protein n=1 Tax=Streptomyces sp. RKND-216 TaxID=2562581 RepID=UPI00109DD61B|nr:hypothetical protein [Streptomyces sp. RKND-216]THA28258.1 hypothetical protein E4198_00140 [Streptomyces sp. RKND-216]